MNMTKVKTQDLSGAALDWAVAKAEGHQPLIMPMGRIEYTVGVTSIDSEGRLAGFACNYSTDWSQTGVLIQKNKIGFGPALGGWVAHPHRPNAPTDWLTADEPLVAICRAIVADKLGMVVSVPSELIS